jgi:hypothetical protein
MRYTLSGREIKQSEYGCNIQYTDFKDESKFELVIINKGILYNKINYNNSKNLVTFNEWKVDNDNLDGYHTDTINNMIKYIKDGNKLPPIIVDKNYGLYDGQHRLTAYSMMKDIENIEVLKEM